MSGSFKTVTFEGRDVATEEDELGIRTSRFDVGRDGDIEGAGRDGEPDSQPREDDSSN